jgi:hypothetical protein
MKLLHIEAESCPQCGSRAVKESQDRRHSNGEFNESREFKCGHVLEYSPNYQRLETRERCPKDPDEVQLRKKRDAALAKVLSYIGKLDVDDRYREALRKGVYWA